MVDNETFLFLSLDGGLILVYLVLQFIQFVLSEIPQPFLVFLSLLWIFSIRALAMLEVMISAL